MTAPAQPWQIIEISRVRPPRERRDWLCCDEQDDGWGIIRPGARVMSLVVLPRQRLFIQTWRYHDIGHEMDSITMVMLILCACVFTVGLDSSKERVIRCHALVMILCSWSLFSLAMIERETVLKSVEFTQARVLEDYHRNPLCHHSKLNAVFKSFQRFLQQKWTWISKLTFIFNS